MSAGGAFSLALQANGKVRAWGGNYLGQTNVPPDLGEVVAVAAGGSHALALQADGTVVAWGANYASQTNVPMGLSNIVGIAAGGSFSLALKSDGIVAAWGDNEWGQTIIAADLADVTVVAGGHDFALALVENAPPTRQVLLSDYAWSSNGFSFSLTTQRGRVYRLEYKNSLKDSDWAALPLVVGDGGVRTLNDPAVAAAQRFYRVRRW